MSEKFNPTASTSVMAMEEHFHDAIKHNEPLDLTFDNGNFVELSVHHMQQILSAEMTQELLDGVSSESDFMHFLTKLFEMKSADAAETHKDKNV